MIFNKINERKINKIYNIKMENYNDISQSDNNIIIITLNIHQLKLILILLFIIIIREYNSDYKYSFSFKNNLSQKENNKNDTVIDFNTLYFWNYTYLKNEMHNYSLYNEFNNPKLSLILIIKDNNENEENNIIDQINFIISQNFINMEILLFLKYDNKFYYLIETEFQNLIKDKILKIYNQSDNNKQTYTNSIDIIKGTYTIFINKLNLVNLLQLKQIYNYTQMPIINYYSFNVTSELSLYLIKSKILKNMLDDGIKFKSYNHIIYKIKNYPIKEINYIHITYCPNNHFTSLVYVSMISILSSKYTNIFICFYLIVPFDFEDKNIKFLNSLHEDYDYFNITFLKLDHRYDNAYISRNITIEAYFRFSVAELLPHVNKILYFDTDVIVYRDLYSFYSLNFNGKIILGQPTIGNRKWYKKNGSHLINSGVLLLNLIEMRNINFEKKVIEIIKKGEILDYHDQSLLYEYFKEYLGIYPPEYHTRPWSNFREMEIFHYKIGKVFDLDYLYFAHKYPTLRHFLGFYKPTDPNINHIEDWWFYARKSKYYNNSADSFNKV